MAFKAGSITADAKMNTSNFDSGVGKIAKGAAMAGVAILAGIGAALWKSVEASNEFQKALSNVATVLPNTVKGTQDLSKALIKMDPALGSTTDLTNGMYQAFSAGAKDAEQAISITENSAKFAKAALTDTATAVDAITTAMNAYGAENVDANKASDIFFTTIKQGKVTGEELAGTIGQSIPLFASMGVPLEELASGMAAMTKQGVNSANATTQLNAIMNSFLKPSEEMSKALQEQGFQSGSAFIESEGLAGALQFLQDETQGSQDKLAGLLPNTRALRGAMALSGQGAEIFAETMAEMEGALGATDEAFGKQEKTFETFQNSAGKIQTVVGNIGKSFVDEWAKGATEANEAMLEFVMSSQFMNIVAETMGFVSGAFSAIKVAVQPIIDSIGPALEGIAKTWSEQFGEGAEQVDLAQMAFQTLAFAGQLVASVIAVLGKIIEGTIVTIANLTKALTASANVMDAFFKAMSGEGTWEEFDNAMENAGDSWSTVGEGFVMSFGGVIDEVTNQFNGFGERVAETSANAESAFNTSSDGMRNHIKSNWDLMITGAKEAGEELVNGLVEPMEEGGDGGPLVTAVKSSFEQAFEEVVKFTNAVEEVMSNWAIGDVWNQIWGGMTAIEAQELQNQSAELDLAFQRDLEALDNKLANESITQEEYDAQKEALEKENNKKKNDIAKKQFEADKKNRMVQVAMDSASAIMGWWNTASGLGFPAGPIFGGVMTGLTLGMAGTQIAAIGSEKFVPAYAMGGTHSGGLAQVNEEGGEIMNLPDGTQIIPHDISKMIAQGAGNGGTVNISLAGANFTDKLNSDRIIERLNRQLGQTMRGAR
jgi:TP901 family phage tail tape measure protein